MKILLTGEPGVGKSTLLSRLVSEFNSQSISGFISKEILNPAGERTGFYSYNVANPDQEKLFAHKADIDSIHLVGPFRVDVSALEEISTWIETNKKLVTIDEIGRMQSKSDVLLNSIKNCFQNSNLSILATIVADDESWSLFFKEFPETMLIKINEANRDYLFEPLNQVLKNSDCFDKLSSNQKLHFIQKFQTLLVNQSYTQLEKLASNTLRYACEESRIELIDENQYILHGDHGMHQVQILDSGIICNCPLFLGQKGYLPGECSHIQTLELIRRK